MQNENRQLTTGMSFQEIRFTLRQSTNRVYNKAS